MNANLFLEFRSVTRLHYCEQLLTGTPHHDANIRQKLEPYTSMAYFGRSARLSQVLASSSFLKRSVLGSQ